MKKYNIKTMEKFKLNAVEVGVPDDPKTKHKYINKITSNEISKYYYTFLKIEKDNKTGRPKDAQPLQVIKSNFGITLIALIITIIVLLILTGVTLNMVMGENGIIKKANTASEETNKESAAEKLSLKITNVQIDSYTSKQRMPTLQELADELDKDSEIEYVKKKNVEVGSLAKVDIGDATSILTKLKDYKYVFEINNKFQLASIDGKQVSDNIINGSSIINNIEISAGEIGGETANFNMNINYKDGYGENDIVAYFVVVNGEVKKLYTTKPSIIEDLNIATKYSIYVMTVDRYAGITKSNTIEIETKDMISQALEFPMITSSGIKNVINKYKDGRTEYVYNKNKECTSSEAVGKNAYDGNEKTLFPGGNVKYTYMSVDSSAWGKKLLIKYETSYKMYHFYDSSDKILKGNDFRDNTKILDIPKDATKLRLYFNEGGGIYEMYVQD